MARRKKQGVIQKIRSFDYDRYVALWSGIAISAVSAWFSILGLAAIFSGSAAAVMVMGSALEAGKVVAASYLYRNWKKIPFLLKVYFTVAVVVLMSITSMGTFGYLSKAHIAQSYASDTIQAQIDHINQQIQSEQSTKQQAQIALAQLDASVNRMIQQGRVQTALQARQAQAADRTTYNNQITQSDNHVQALLNQRQPLDQQLLAAHRDVGPIRYVAQLIYGSSNDTFLEKAVQYMIIFLVIVFDPLAVLLIMMATQVKHTEDVEEVATKSNRKYDKEAKEWLRRGNAVNADKDWKPMNVEIHEQPPKWKVLK